jgi:small subunit ribosomal protein S21
MPKIILKPNEKIDFAIRRFKKACDKAKIIQDYRDHEFFTTSTEKKKISLKQAQKRERKKDQK